ncbi:hypothetical protein PMI30_01594 [Pseudomonas sp. GM50]|nr:hypothetical protein PMI30_01594 [Pseudomonas sp. GM50]
MSVGSFSSVVTKRRGVTLFCFLVLFALFIRNLINNQAYLIQISPSGRYIMENVGVGRWWYWNDMAYLRVIDRQHPEKVYRTPLYEMDSFDMRAFEDEKEVGIVWIYFDLVNKAFTVHMPQWKPHWLNYFISNTPYEAGGND